MLSAENVMQLIQSLIWLLAGVGVFIVGMNFMSDALEKSAGDGMKKMLGRISNNRFSGVGIGAGVTAIIQSSSATSVMVIGLVNAGVMTLMQATPIIMGANIGTTITGVLVALKNDYFNMLMYLLAQSLRARKAGFYAMAICGVLFIATSAFAISSRNEMVKGKGAVIMSSSVSIKSSPDRAATELFVLHEGTTVVVGEKIEGWVEIRIADGRKGWIEESRIERI